MEARHWGMVAAALLVEGGLVWGLAWFWFGRKLRRAAGQQERVDKARQFAAQQASQARRQVEVLQNELGELRRQLTAVKKRQQAGPPADPPLVAPPPPPAPMAPPLDDWPEPADNGFADTQVQTPGKRGPL